MTSLQSGDAGRRRTACARTPSSHEHTHHPHVAVVNRPVVGGQVPSLVFGELDEGLYDLCVKGTEDVRLSVAVRGGEVVEKEWPA